MLYCFNNFDIFSDEDCAYDISDMNWLFVFDIVSVACGWLLLVFIMVFVDVSSCLLLKVSNLLLILNSINWVRKSLFKKILSILCKLLSWYCSYDNFMYQINESWGNFLKISLFETNLRLVYLFVLLVY